jgi:hypothetical protein
MEKWRRRIPPRYAALPPSCRHQLSRIARSPAASAALRTLPPVCHRAPNRGDGRCRRAPGRASGRRRRRTAEVSLIFHQGWKAALVPYRVRPGRANGVMDTRRNAGAVRLATDNIGARRRKCLANWRISSICSIAIRVMPCGSRWGQGATRQPDFNFRTPAGGIRSACCQRLSCLKDAFEGR